VTFCAALAWNFHERDALLEFRSVEASTSPARPRRIFLRFCATWRWCSLIAPNSRPELLNQLAAGSRLIQNIVTSQPRGSIPSELWNTSYIVFASDLSA